MNKLILLDLENTIIHDWDDSTFIFATMDHIKEFLDAESPFSTIGVFSFAIWDRNDLDVFNADLRHRIEDVFDVQLDDEWIICRDDLLPIFKKILHMPFLTSYDLHSYLSKDMIAHIQWWNKWSKEMPDTEIVILDDMFNDMTCTMGSSVLHTVNPWSLVNGI